MNPMDPAILRSSVETIDSLPSIPTSLKQIMNLIGSSRVTLEEIANLISQDLALTSRVLKVVNSAIYGVPERISSISYAIMMLGMDTVRGLVIGAAAFELMQKVMAGLWRHSIACATVARIIAVRKDLRNVEEVAIAALLHDVGKVCFGLKYPLELKLAMDQAQDDEITLLEAEKGYFAEDHAAAGRWLTEKWRFNRKMVEIIACHHVPRLSRTARLETSIVHFADILVRARGIGFAGDKMMPVLDDKAFDMLRLSKHDIRRILEELEESLDE